MTPPKTVRIAAGAVAASAVVLLLWAFVIEPRSLGGGVSVYDSPAPEFRLYRADLAPGGTVLPGEGGARIVLCTEGTGILRAGQAALKVGRGESCFIPVSDGVVTASGPAALFIAGMGQ